MSFVLCAIAFAVALVLTWRSTIQGLAAVLTTGYLFGIVRANVIDTASYFIYDASVLGFFLSYVGGAGLKTANDPRQILLRWMAVLIGWAVVMFLIPMQHPLIQLVGLRACVFMLPFLIVGAGMTSQDADRLALWLSVLNFIAFGFALAEYVIGVPAFFPRNAVTELIYRSNDVAGYTALRIPATFSNAASYGGTMLSTMPWLLGAWVQTRLVDWQKTLVVCGMALALMGMFMCASRSPLVLLVPIVVVATLSGQLKGAAGLVWVVLIAGVVYIVSGEERMQRVLSLGDTNAVVERIEGSVNLGFLELLLTYPFGRGMGAGGTSVPYFLQNLITDHIYVENEYSRIMLEQGVAGLILWVGFVVWLIGRWPSERRDSWLLGRRLLWVFCMSSFGTAIIGIGLMTAIPQSMLLFLSIGFMATPPMLLKRKASPTRTDQAAVTAEVPASVPSQP